MKVDGNNVFLKARPVAGNPCGDIVINLLNNEVQLGFSSRALAKLVKTKSGVTETYCRKIISLSDIVYDPSCSSSFISGVLEGQEWVYQNGVIVEAKGFDAVVESVQDQFKSMTKKTKDKVVLKVFREYFDALLKSK
jgi:hypothetical protein